MVPRADGPSGIGFQDAAPEPRPGAPHEGEATMDTEWRHQIRVYLPEELAEPARSGGGGAPALRPLMDVLAAHRATLVSQLDAFEGYIAEAERDGPEGFPLYRWTKAALDDPAKRLKHKQAFAVRVAGEEVYAKGEADALEAALRPLVGAGAVARISRHDTNPANNLAVPPEYRS